MKELDDLLVAVANYVEAILAEELIGYPANIYKKVFKKIEMQTIEEIMCRTQYHQGVTASIMGYGRSTLRKKLKDYFGNKYIGENEKC